MNAPTHEWQLEGVIDQAADWFNRHRSGEPLTAKDQDAFLSWLRTSPLHVHGYLEVARLATALPEALAGLDRVMGQPRASRSAATERGNVVPLGVLIAEEARGIAHYPSVRPGSHRLFGVAVMAAVISVLVALMTGDASRLWLGPPQLITTSYAQLRTVHLQDGSMIYLNSGTQMRVRYSPSSRLVELMQGEALFKVAHDSAWPFRVRAGAADILDVGTQFDLDRAADRTTITVLQGEVEVLRHDTAANVRSGSPPYTPPLALQLQAGQEVQVGPAIIAPQVVTADVRHATDWLHRNISFDDRPLGEVMTEINRYAPVQVVIEEPSLRKLRVSGVLDVYDTGGLVLFLKQYGVIERTPQEILVARPANKKKVGH